MQITVTDYIGVVSALSVLEGPIEKVRFKKEMSKIVKSFGEGCEDTTKQIMFFSKLRCTPRMAEVEVPRASKRAKHRRVGSLSFETEVVDDTGTIQTTSKEPV